MDYSATIDLLAAWVSSPNRVPVRFQNGNAYYFGVSHRFVEDELLEIERRFAIRLPQSYKRLLSSVGAGVLFGRNSRKPTGIEIRRVDYTCLAFAQMSSLPISELFANYLPIGVNHDDRRALLISLKGQFTNIFQASTLPKQWEDVHFAESEGTPLEEWLAGLVESKLATN